MKTLIILLALVLTMPIYASNAVEQKTKSASELLKEYNSKKPESDHVGLENQIVKLQLELRDTRRKYYAAKTENNKLKSELATVGKVKGYTKDQVKQILASAQSDMYYDTLTYAIAERKFLLSLSTIEDMVWLLVRMEKTDTDRMEELKGADKTYQKDIADIVAEYKSYFDANRKPPEAQE